MMASDSVKEPLLKGLQEPTHQTDQKSSPRRKKILRCKSAPMSGPVHQESKKFEAFLQHPKSIFDELTPDLRTVALYLFIYLAVGTLCFYLIRNQISGKKTHSVLDALYFTIVTMTSVGYGDLSPRSNLAILMSCLFVLTGMLLIGLVLGKAADFLVEKQEIVLAKALHMHEKVDEAGILEEMETNRVRNKCIILFILLVVIMFAGTCFLLAVEDLDFVHAFYCVVGTLTSLGYIDKCFSTTSGRVFALFWILSGTIYLAQLLFAFALLHTQRRQRSLVKWVLTRRTTIADLEAADLDADGVVGAAEFVLFKLKEMGKISQKDISLVMEEFETLDVDQSGTLSISDIFLAQSTQKER